MNVDNTGDEAGVVNTETCHLPDNIKAWKTKNSKDWNLEQLFELAGVSPVKTHGKHSSRTLEIGHFKQ